MCVGCAGHRRCRSTKPFPRLYDDASLYMTLVVPAYNEEERLPAMLDEMLRYLKHRASENRCATPGASFTPPRASASPPPLAVLPRRGQSVHVGDHRGG